jgi:hypothetical protein
MSKLKNELYRSTLLRIQKVKPLSDSSLRYYEIFDLIANFITILMNFYR